MRRLTEKQRRFVESYMATGNATNAAIQAGYPRKAARQVGAENLSKPVIREALTARQAADPAVMQREEAQRWLSQVIRGEMKVEVMVRVGGEYQSRMMPASCRDRLRAAELLARTGGWFDEGSASMGPTPLQEAWAESTRILEEDSEAAMEMGRIYARVLAKRDRPDNGTAVRSGEGPKVQRPGPAGERF